jgi:hypothetical protein
MMSNDNLVDAAFFLESYLETHEEALYTAK